MTIARDLQSSPDRNTDINKGHVILLEDKLNELVDLNQRNEQIKFKME